MSHLPHCVRVLHRAGMAAAHRADRAPRSLVEVRARGPLPGSVLRTARHHPEATAVVDEAGSHTYADLRERSAVVAPAVNRFRTDDFDAPVGSAPDREPPRPARATALMLVPTMLRRIPGPGPLERESHDLSALRVVLGSGADPEEPELFVRDRPTRHKVPRNATGEVLRRAPR